MMSLIYTGWTFLTQFVVDMEYVYVESVCVIQLTNQIACYAMKENIASMILETVQWVEMIMVFSFHALVSITLNYILLIVHFCHWR